MNPVIMGHQLRIDPETLGRLATDGHSDESIALYLVDGLELGHLDSLRDGRHDEWRAWLAEHIPHCRPHVVCWHLARWAGEFSVNALASAVGRHAVAYGRIRLLVTRETEDQFWGHLTKDTVMGNRYCREGAGPFRFDKAYVELL